MKLKFIAFFLSLSFVCFSQQVKKDFKRQFLEEKIEFFYIEPTPAAAKQIIKEAKELNCMEDLLGIFAAFAKYYPKEIVNWMKENEICLEHCPRLIEALYMGGLQGESIDLAVNANWPAHKIMSLGNKVQSFLTIPLNFVGSVQYMCSYFYVSGDVRYGKRIIDVLELTPEQMKKNEELDELKRVAKTVLKELIFKHDKIYRLCLEEVKLRKGYSRTVLTELLDEQYEAQKKAFPHQNGMLSGMIITTDDTSFEEQWENLPVMEGPFFKLVSSVSYPDTPDKNKTIRIFIVFNGYELDEDLNAFLTYDLEILDPKGTKVVDFHALPALKRKMPSRLLSQLADQPTYFAIECGETDDGIDSSGIFLINATLKDHVAHKDLKLTAKIELLQPEKKRPFQ
ncbi:MAG TPA: hypothetical protein VLG76_00775 [Rhabdochlamydiaceae bacterium]|nr:hypothetical protein [Rhabdochlamydiaceae bacterium]